MPLCGGYNEVIAMEQISDLELISEQDPKINFEMLLRLTLTTNNSPKTRVQNLI